MSNFKHSKRYREVSRKLKKLEYHSLADALNFCKENNQEKSPTIKVAFHLYWNEKKTPIRSNLSLPHPATKPMKIAIITDEKLSDIFQDQERVDVNSVQPINLEQLTQVIKKKKSKWGFQKLLAHSSWQEKIKVLAKDLGTKKMFPTSKDGTLTSDLLVTVREIQKGGIKIRTDKDGNIHSLLGKASFSLTQLEENYKILYKSITSLKPSNWKGDYLKGIFISTAHGPAIRVKNN